MRPPNTISTLPYKASKKIQQWLTAHSNDPRPSSFPYLSGDTFRKLADHLFDSTTQLDPSTVKEKGVVFVQADMLDEFFQIIHPKIKKHYVLISHNSDPNIDSDYFSFVDEKIIHWFAQSLIDLQPRVTPIPLGLENFHFHNHGVISRFDYWRQHLPEKRSRILVSFGIETNPQERQPAFDALKDHPLAETLYPPLITPKYIEKLVAYKFVASPPGNSLDCHRTWEAMYLKVIPIVKKSPMTEYFKSLDLPMFLVEDWQELYNLKESDLDSIYQSLEAKFDNSYLWMPGWQDAINQKKLP
jgi:hypothetical protein